MKLEKLFAISTAGLVGCMGSYYLFRNSVSEKITKSKLFQEVIESVRKNKGAVHFLGEPIEVGRAQFNNLGMNSVGHSAVKVHVKGPKSDGELFFKIIKEEEVAKVDSIQLQIGMDDSKRLVIPHASNNTSS